MWKLTQYVRWEFNRFECIVSVYYGKAWIEKKKKTSRTLMYTSIVGHFITSLAANSMCTLHSAPKSAKKHTQHIAVWIYLKWTGWVCNWKPKKTATNASFVSVLFFFPSSQFGKDDIVTWIAMRFISEALIDSKIRIEFVENGVHVIYVVAHYSACDIKQRKKHGITFVWCPHIQSKQTIHLYKQILWPHRNSVISTRRDITTPPIVRLCCT